MKNKKTTTTMESQKQALMVICAFLVSLLHIEGIINECHIHYRRWRFLVVDLSSKHTRNRGDDSIWKRNAHLNPRMTRWGGLKIKNKLVPLISLTISIASTQSRRKRKSWYENLIYFLRLKCKFFSQNNFNGARRNKRRLWLPGWDCRCRSQCWSCCTMWCFLLKNKNFPKKRSSIMTMVDPKMVNPYQNLK